MIDWVKMRTDLYRDPKVIRMAEHLEQSESLQAFVRMQTGDDLCVTRNVTRCATVGALVTVWGVTRHQGRRNDADLILDGATLSTIDDMADLPGIGEAMASVGWVIDTGDDCLTFPKFFEDNNIEPKTKAAERQKRYRDNKRKRNVTRCAIDDVTRNVTGDDRVEESKRREEKTKTKPLTPLPELVFPPELDTDTFRAGWLEWEAYKLEQFKFTFKPRGRKAAFNQAIKRGPTVTLELIQQSMSNGWMGLIEKGAQKGNGKPASQPQGPGVNFDPNNNDPDRGIF